MWADEEMLHCLLLAAVTGIRPSGVIPFHHVGLAASDLAPQDVKTSKWSTQGERHLEVSPLQ